MRKHSILGYILFAAILVTTGCHKDKGNYDYREINEITIKGIEDYYPVAVGLPLTIKPELDQTIPASEENLSYLWLKMGTTAPTGQFDTIWREKHLDNELLPLPITKSKIVYKVMDKTTGITYASKLFEIEIFNDAQKGFLLLTENEGKTDLKFLNYTGSTVGNLYLDGKFELRTVDLSSLPELGRPYNIACYNDMFNAPTLGGDRNVSIAAIRLCTETGMYSLRRSDFHYEDLYHGSYMIFGGLTGLQVRRIIRASAGVQWSCMIMDHDNNFMMYRTAGPAQTQYWTVGSYTNSYQQTGKLEKVFRALPPPAMAFNGVSSGVDLIGAVFYDLDSKSFAYRYGSMTLYSSKYGSDKEVKFKFNDTDFTPRFIYYRPSQEDADTPRSVYSIVKQNAADEMYLLKWQIETGTQFDKQKLYPLSDNGVTLPGIQDAKYFAMGTTADLRPFIFYTTENKVYVYNQYDKGVTDAWTVPGGNKITHIEVLHPMISQSISVACPFANHLVVISEAPDGTSTFQVCKIADTYGTLTMGQAGPVDAKKPMEWSGLPKIVSFDWKLL